MKINDELLSKLEKLSSLKIADDKREETVKEIGQIVDFVENLSELDLDDKDDHFSTIEGGTPYREDTPQKNPQVIEDILACAPRSKEGFFVVPKIIE
jgi:aspartyl-tRNA(Asn)/glutamyl-tRNA(Gln) amidotransferase subunit C